MSKREQGVVAKVLSSPQTKKENIAQGTSKRKQGAGKIFGNGPSLEPRGCWLEKDWEQRIQSRGDFQLSEGGGRSSVRSETQASREMRGNTSSISESWVLRVLEEEQITTSNVSFPSVAPTRFASAEISSSSSAQASSLISVA